jgi:hypothetical protein
MPFLSSVVTHRRLVMLCVRLMVQCTMGWSMSQTGMDDSRSFRVLDATSNVSIARYEREMIMPAALRQTEQLRLPC